MNAPRRTADRHGESAGGDRGGREREARRARRLAQRKADSMPVVDAVEAPKQERVVDAPLREPAFQGGMLQVLQQPYMLKLVVQRQLAQMYAASLLGLFWSYVQPAMRFLVYFLIFGYVFKGHQGPYFAMHLFTGMVVVHYFSETWSGGTRSIWSNRQLVKKMRMPREIFPVAAMITAAYHTLPQLLLLVVFCLVIGWHVSLTAVLAGLLGTAILVTFSMIMALCFSAWNVFYRDFQNVVATLMQFMHFVVPMLYPFERIWSASHSHPVIYNLYMANPVAQAVLLLQRLFWAPLVKPGELPAHSFPPDMYERGLITLLICLVLLYLSQRMFSRLESRFPERM